MSDGVQSVRQLLQDFIAPELRELKSDVRRIDSKIDLMTEGLEAKIDSKTGSLGAKIGSESKRLEDRIVSEVGCLEDKVDSGFPQMRTLLENAYLRSELEATRDISNLRERVTRLEVERGSRQ
jgi:hypothetical protein